MPWFRATLVWMLIMLAETGHGMVREVFIAPVIGGFRARQIGVLVACVLIFVIAWLTTRWMNASTRRQQLTIGAYWVLLTLLFEFVLGRATGASWSRLLSDYNPARGGVMLLGLAFMFITPWLTRKLR
jgi:lipoprotein signal peptidase